MNIEEKACTEEKDNLQDNKQTLLQNNLMKQKSIRGFNQFKLTEQHEIIVDIEKKRPKDGQEFMKAFHQAHNNKELKDQKIFQGYFSKWNYMDGLVALISNIGLILACYYHVTTYNKLGELCYKDR